MLQQVDAGPRSLDAYARISPDDHGDHLRRISEILKGARVVHINATSYGGGVSELLRSTVPLLKDLGVVVDWKTVAGDDLFFRLTKKIHNALQDAAEDLTEAEREAYLRPSRRNAELFEDEYGFATSLLPHPTRMCGLSYGSTWPASTAPSSR